jgi:hypothetical protein
MMVAAKSEDLEFPPPYLGNSSKGDAHSQTMSFSVRPGTDIQDLVHNLLTFVIAQREAINFINLVMRRKMHYDNRNNLNLMS